MSSSAALVVWREVEGELKPFARDSRGVERAAAWAPQPGAQEAFLACPVFECLLTGPRGGGKTDTLLMDFGQHVGQGWGQEWRGILFRQTFPQLADVIVKSKKWFSIIWPGAKFNEQKSTWNWPTGESLRFSFMAKPDDYWNYHGHSYPWIAWEELTTWPDSQCFLRMMACSRSSKPLMPRKYRATTNPYGPGHNWVKARYRLPVPLGMSVGKVIDNSLTRDGQLEPPRVAINLDIYENRVLLLADPGYVAKIRAAASNPSQLAAWLYGSWDITSGGMFDDLWDPRVHVVPNLPLDSLPRGWRVDRSYDHGQSKPFSVGWWAESNGEPLMVGGRLLGPVKGDLFRVAEWYGWNGQPNEGLRMMAREVGDGIRDRERDWAMGHVLTGPADSSIFDQFEPGKSVAGDMEKAGVRWNRADKGPGSRKQGWEQTRKLLKAALPGSEGVREAPGLFICERCTQFLRTVPVLPRDEKDPDDVDTEAEDHVGDEVRYRVRHKRTDVDASRWK